MKKQIKADWCQALKSGEFKQTKEQLWDQESNAYCCLGVLTRLYCRAKKVPFSQVNGDTVGDNDVLNKKVMDWAGLKENNPTVEGLELSAWNDGQYGVAARNFKEIAALIHKNKL